MSTKHSVLLAIAVVWIAAVVALAIAFYVRIHTFTVEDRIHRAFFPLARALYDYEDDHGAPATNLMQLVPAYLPQIPSSRWVDSVEYSVAESGTVWQLGLHSHALSRPRLYCCRSTQAFTASEQRRVVLRYHACWTVLEE